MKYSSHWKTSLAVLALASAQNSGAVVLAGFYDFIGAKLTNPPPNNPANVIAPGWIAWAESPGMSAQGGGGSMDGFYGNSAIAVGGSPSWGDGFAAIKVYPQGTNGVSPTGSSVLTFRLTNNSGSSVAIAGLLFDAAASTGQDNRYVQVDFINALGTTPLGSYGPLDPTAPQWFSDYGVGLGNYVMANSETVSFEFTATAGSPVGTVVWVDNVAIVTPESWSPVGMPDSGSTLTLLGVAIAGLSGFQRLKKNRKA